MVLMTGDPGVGKSTLLLQVPPYPLLCCFGRRGTLCDARCHNRQPDSLTAVFRLPVPQVAAMLAEGNGGGSSDGQSSKGSDGVLYVSAEESQEQVMK